MIPEYNDRCVWAYDIEGLADEPDQDWRVLEDDSGRLFSQEVDNPRELVEWHGSLEMLVWVLALDNAGHPDDWHRVAAGEASVC